MTVGFLVIAFAMVLAGLAALWTGSDPAMLSFGQTLMVIGAILVSGGFILAVLALALRQLTAIRTLLAQGSGEALAPLEETYEPVMPQVNEASPAPDSAAPAPAALSAPPSPPVVATLTPPPAPPPMPVQNELPPPPPRRVPGFMAAAAAGALGGAAAFSFGRKDKSEEPAPEETSGAKDDSKPLPPRDDLEAMLVEVLGAGARKPTPPEPLELDMPVLPLKGGEALPEPAPEPEPVDEEIREEPTTPASEPEPLDLSPPPIPAPSIPLPDSDPASLEAEEPSLLREGVIASIPFRLYSNGSIVAQIDGAERSFTTLKEFRDFVGVEWRGG